MSYKSQESTERLNGELPLIPMRPPLNSVDTEFMKLDVKTRKYIIQLNRRVLDVLTVGANCENGE